MGGPDLEKFLTNLLSSEEDAGLRSQAATALGHTGSEKCLATLAQVAGNDRTTRIEIGCIGGLSSARRAATFAIAELANRFPRLAPRALTSFASCRSWVVRKRMRAWPMRGVQALYQITHDKALLKAFYSQPRAPTPWTAHAASPRSVFSS